jgi:hypothetical protein
VLFLDSHCYSRALRAFAQFRQVSKPLSRTPRERYVRRRGVEHEQLGVADDREIQRTVEGSLAGLLQIDCAEYAAKARHLASFGGSHQEESLICNERSHSVHRAPPLSGGLID